MKKYLAELIGTFALVFCGTGAIVIDDVSSGAVTNVGIGITFGFIVMAMIYTFGRISGAHINPAVSIAFAFTDRFNRRNLMGYLIGQCTGALLASVILALLFPNHDSFGSTRSSGSWIQTFVLELILTYILMLVILFVSQNKKIEAFTGLAVGATVGVEAIFAGPITGASMNPARSLGPAVVSMEFSDLWMYVLAPILGAIMASVTWWYFKD